jgi:hypothetical protein
MICKLDPPCVVKPREDWPKLEWDGPALGKRAAARPSDQRIWIDSEAWLKLEGQPRVRLAMIAKMRAHLEGAECDLCAEERVRDTLKTLLYPITFDEIEQLLRDLEAGNVNKRGVR